jgi:hypothetical protein
MLLKNQVIKWGNALEKSQLAHFSGLWSRSDKHCSTALSE